MRRNLRLYVAGALAVGAMALGSGCSEKLSIDAAPTSEATEAASQEARPTPTSVPTLISRGTALSAAELVKLAEPAIVRVSTGGGVGTGFVVSADGYIVTNNHVVSTGRTRTTVTVTMSDGAVLPAEVIGTDPKADLALLKVNRTDLQPLPIGQLADVQVGDDVLAIGYALDLKGGEGAAFTVTRGIVSAKNRAISESTPSAIAGAIQTDAAINHGNSGGPLLNLQGQVIGVNTALQPDPNSESGVAQGIGYAVGADTLKAVIEELQQTGRVRRGYLGIQQFEALRPAKAKDLGIPEKVTGILLPVGGSVVAGGPAALGGLQGGDVITKIGSVSIKTEADLSVAMIKADPDQEVTVEFYRNGKATSTKVRLAARPDE